MKIKLNINGRRIEAEEGSTLLKVLNDNGIKVPTLCHLKNMMPTGSCRLCVVEDTDTNRLITSCSALATEGMNILTHSQRVTESRKVIVELLLSNHSDDCLYCVRNGSCELQNLSEELCVTERRITGKKNQHRIDSSSESIVRDQGKCILCGRCVRVCEEIMGIGCIDFISRGSRTKVSTAFEKGMNTSCCVNCGQCIMVCPTGALTERSHLAEIKEALANPEKKVVVQYAPSITVSVAEAFGMKPGEDIAGIINAVLRKIGFDYVFDTSFAADLTIMEEIAELVERIKTNKPIPMFTSCCPAWVKYAEEFYPELIPNISTCKSPQQMAGSIIKSYFAGIKNIDPESIYSVSLMPCTAKKFEGKREEMTKKGVSDIDAVLTTRELIKLIKLFGIKLNEIEPELADSPLGIRSTAGKIFGASGGVAEAAIRTAICLLNGEEPKDLRINEVRGAEGIKETRIKTANLEIGVAVVNGLGNARRLLEEIKAGRKDLNFIEIMTCPGGCISGGGQPFNMDGKIVMERARSLYRADDSESLKVSHKNPDIMILYKNFLDQPLGERSHELLHTNYSKRDLIV